MSEGQQSSPTFGIQASGTTPANESRSVSEASLVPQEQPGAPVQQEQSARMYADKYESVEALEKSYMELQQKFSEARPKTSEMTIESVLDAAGVKSDDMFNNFREDGRLSDDQYSKMENMGWSRSVIDQFLQGQVAIAQNGVYAQDRMQRHAHDLAGGQEEFDGLMRWAAQTLPEERIDALNKRLEDPQGYEGAIKELLWDFKVQTGRGGTQELLSGETMPNTTSGFTSVVDLLDAMRSAREQGYMDEATKRRISNTPSHILSGVE